MPKPMGADGANLSPTATLPPQSTVSVAAARSSRTTKMERRRTSRFPCNLPTACVVISLVEPVLLSVRVRNISQRGIGLLVQSRVAPGAFLAIKVQGPKQKVARILRARVVHATFLPEIRTWLIGGHFVDELRKEELSQLC